MIKFDRDVHSVLKTLEKEGFETYAAGECVRDTLRGATCLDWDLVSRANADDVCRLFPDGVVIDEEKQIVRIDLTHQVKGDEGEPDRIEGVILDVRRFEGDIEDFLRKGEFTINAMADNPERTFADPFGGREDIRKKLIRTVDDPGKMFKEEPIRMMRAVRIASEVGFDLHQEVFDAILSNWRLLLESSIGLIREELEKLLVTENAGKGLKTMAESGLMAVVFGEEVSRKMNHTDMQAFNTVCENIDKTKPVKTRRLGLLFTTLSRRKARAAIERMEFDPKTEQHLKDGVDEIVNLTFLNDGKTFKRYLFEHGLERYEYLHNLSKAMRIVYDQPAVKIESRNYMMKEIRNNKEPVFVEDLVIDANDILEAGIVDSAERAEELLDLVIAVVHSNPKNNQRDVLLKMAKKYSRNKIAAKTRYVRWIR
ncbi:MAG: hypothetical protein ACLU5F_03760 [Anaerovoracaceae bacterium]